MTVRASLGPLALDWCLNVSKGTKVAGCWERRLFPGLARRVLSATRFPAELRWSICGTMARSMGGPTESALSLWVREPCLSIIIAQFAGNWCHAVNFR